MAKYRPIRAYHGSPHLFDSFDSSKIGTGEGSAAYGHGMYFAGNEDVADGYRKATTAVRRGPLEDAKEYWRRHAEISGNKQKAVLDALDQAEESLQSAAGIESAEGYWADVIRHLNELDFRQPLPPRPGHMYEVDIDVPESALLKYDQPFAAQSPKVQSVLSELMRGLSDSHLPPEQMKGRHYYDEAARHWGGVPPASRLGPPAASGSLMARGVPGIVYSNVAWGRSKGDRSPYNYVMFPGTESRIRVLRRYGLLAPIAAGAAAGQGDGTRTDATMQPILGGLTQ